MADPQAQAQVTAPPQTVTATSSAQSPTKAEPSAQTETKPAPVKESATTPSPAPAVEAQAPKADAKLQEQVAEPKYELKLPEGSPLDPERDIAAAVEFAKAHKLSPEIAQKHLERVSAEREAFIAQQQEQVTKTVDAWLEDCKKHPTFGGEKFPESSENSKRFLQKHASPQFIELLNKTGMGNHPLFFEFVAGLGAGAKPDQIVTGNETRTAPEKSMADVMFPMDELIPKEIA